MELLYTILTLLFVITSIILIRQSKESFLYICLLESMFPLRFYSDLYGIPVMVILPLYYIAIYFSEIKIKRTPKIVLVFLLLNIYMFFSYYSYYKSFYLVLLNNLLWLYIMLFSISSANIKQVENVFFIMARVIGFILTIILFIAFFAGNYKLFGNPRQIAFYLIICFTAILIDNRKTKDFKKTLMLFFFFGGILISQGRLPLLITIICTTIFFLFFAKQIYLKIGIVVFLLSLQILYHSNFVQDYLYREERKDFSEALTEDNAFTSGRSAIYECAWSQFHDYPIMGMGYMSFKSPDNLYNIFYSGGNESISCHSVWIQYLAEIGIVGTVLYAIVLLWFILKGLWLEHHANGIQVFSCMGRFCFFFGIIFVLGATIDNHGFHYRIIYIIALLMILQEDYILNLKNNPDNDLNGKTDTNLDQSIRLNLEQP